MDHTDLTGSEADPEAFDEFPGLLAAVQRRFAAHAEGPLFFTDATGLWPLFLDHIPTALRQHYTCNACRHFVERYGALVAIDDKGRLHSALWGEAPAGFERAFKLMAEAVTTADPCGVLVPATQVLGTPVSPAKADGTVWTHFAVTVPHAHSHALLSASQVQAERKEDRGMLARGLAEFPQALVERAHALLTSGTLYRSEKCIGVATWLLELHRSLAGAKTQRHWDALVWRAAATAPAGFAHVRSSMIGTLLEDLANGLDSAAIKRRFDEKMAPSQYMRAQVAPTAGNIAQAEKVIAALKATGALDRRYARLADLTCFLWRPRPAQANVQPGSVFGHLTPKAKSPSGKLALPQQTLTWEKFVRTVLPEAIAIEAQVPAVSDRFMALVTAASADAPPILQWDAEGQRNPLSWYYHAGIDAEIKRRVEGAGGQYEGVDIRASLLWDNRNDLDLHVITPAREHIYFGAKRSGCGGWLDVDMNVRGETTTPVENIRWARGAAPHGRYRIYVQNYRFHEPSRLATPWKVEVEISGEIYHFTGVISPGQQTGGASDMTVFEFDYEPGQRLTQAPRHAVPQQQGTGQWNVRAGAWVPVTAIVSSPNLWGERPLVQHGRHTFFLLEGCRDTAAGRGRGFFTETLRSDFHAIRATLEAFNRTAEIAGADEAEACGLGMTDQKPWNLALRVTTANAVASYVLDRWD
ncbi:hypothetical protein [Nannocystis sp.]|uniref:YfaP family protein n=1 Tax=Nannocystis sp. TaxID=1962667 RepID=UPI0025F586ED|nr:hypothetical protein [Nannocystis sp.]MBK7828093.1 hypothetical protein [Nannocystis sp.]